MPISIRYTRAQGRSGVNATILDGATAVTDGTWISVEGYQPLTVEVVGIDTATVTLHTSNAPTPPANSTHGTQVNSFTSDDTMKLDDPVRWLKVRVTSYNTGSISAYVTGYQGS